MTALEVIRGWWPSPDKLLHAIAESTPWERRRGPFGRHVPRWEAWHHLDGLDYTYSRRTYKAHPLQGPIAEVLLRLLAEDFDVNSCLANLYENGQDSVGWHRDDEPGIGPVICSLSLGASRTFETRDEGVVTRTILHSGDLLVMPNTLEHRVPKEPHVRGVRVNLTFRQMGARP